MIWPGDGALIRITWRDDIEEWEWWRFHGIAWGMICLKPAGNWYRETGYRWLRVDDIACMQLGEDFLPEERP